MITDIIIALISTIISPLIDLIPTFDTFIIPTNINSYLLSIFKTVGFIIPLKELLPIFIFMIAVVSWRFIYAILIRIKNLF